jgi:hypothetical protein
MAIKGGRSFGPAFVFILSMERFLEYQEATGKAMPYGVVWCC